MLEGEDWARFTITAEKDANLLVIRATADVHKIFDAIIEELDQPTDNPSTPLRFYKLQNAKAIEVFFTLQALQQLSIPAVPASTRPRKSRRVHADHAWHGY